jgi:hypothetical protein
MAAVPAIAGAAAGYRPVLWLSGASVPAATAAALRSLHVGAATIVGPTATVPESAAAAVRALGVRVDRLAATDRYQLAVDAWTALAPDRPAPLVLVASAGGRAWPAVLAAAATGRPVLLTARLVVGAPTLTWLRAHPPTRTTVVGGLDAVDTAVLRAFTTATAAGARR